MSHGPFGPESIVVFRFVAPRWLAAYQFPFQLLLSASPLPGHITPAPDPLAIATPAHSPSRAASRCTAKLPAESLADRKSTRLNSSHGYISYAVFCLKKKKKKQCNHFILKKKKKKKTKR